MVAWPLALGHTNLFIPFTLCGSPYSPETGLLDTNKVKKNLETATSVYIEHVNRCPCGETVIHLFPGADSSSFQEQRTHLMVYLKCSKKKDELKVKKLNLFSYFKAVSVVRKRHEVTDLPPQYLFVLVCCFQSSCSHPLCQKGKMVSL